MSIFSEEKNVVDYYEKTFFDYFVLLRLWQHWGMHYGLFDENHKKLKDAMLNTNRILAEKAGIEQNMKVLDAGCGVGGSAIWIARNVGAHVTGINIVEQQYRKAKELAKKYGVADKTEFFIRDFRKTDFPDATFDVVWAIESVDYAEDKRDFLKEAWRVLRPGGHLVIADGFQKKEHLTPKEEELLLEKWLKHWGGIPNLATIGGFVSMMRKIGFQNIQYEDVTQNILPFSRWLYRWSLFGYPLAKILEWLGIRSKIGTGNVIGAIWQYRALQQGLWAYMIYVARK